MYLQREKDCVHSQEDENGMAHILQNSVLRDGCKTRLIEHSQYNNFSKSGDIQ